MGGRCLQPCVAGLVLSGSSKSKHVCVLVEALKISFIYFFNPFFCDFLCFLWQNDSRQLAFIRGWNAKFD